MKKLIAVLLSVLVLLSALSVLCFAEYPVPGRDEPSVETAVENTIGKWIPTGEDTSNAVFGFLDSMRGFLNSLRDVYEDLLYRFRESIQSIEWVPGWMR